MRPRSSIVSSVSGREVDFTGPAYGAFKAALIHYAQRLALQFAPKMIRVNTCRPAIPYFARRRVALDREEYSRSLHKIAFAQSDRAAWQRRRNGARHRFPRQPASGFTTGTNL